VFPNPCKWQEPEKFKHQKGRDSTLPSWAASNRARPALALFPEILKAEFHGIRSVIEAHSATGCGQDAEKGTANGLTFDGSSPVTLRVRTAEGLASYTIDRMD
jgi:hypothetical protein